MAAPAPDRAAGPDSARYHPVMYIPSWLLDGSGILLPGWLFLANTGTFVDLPGGDGRYYAPATEGRVATMLIDPGSDGKVALVDAKGQTPWVTLPGTAGEAMWMFAWVGDGIYVHRVDKETGETRCLQVRGEQIQTPTCLEGGFLFLSGLVAGPGGRVVLSSYGEGHPAVEVIGWTGGASTPVPMPWEDLYPFGAVEMFPRADGSFDIHTTCPLGPARPCLKADGTGHEGSPIRHYRWTPGSSPTLIAKGKKAERAQDPTQERAAWMKGGQLCVGGKGRTTCFEGPKPAK